MHEPQPLSRRKVLGAIGTIGGAAAVGGAGTMAFFSDDEGFANNQLVAGELDLLVDWEEHYSDWRGAETEYDVQMSDPGEGFTPLPTASDPMIWVEDDDLEGFMEATAIEAFPDTQLGDSADDGLQDVIPSDNECRYLRTLLKNEDDEWISPLESPARTQGEVNGQATAPGDSLVSISDVKPGDFGEVTFSLHLCDNPGYLWVNGSLEANLENGVTEPEAEDPDENGGEPGELGEAIQVLLWYDTGADGTYEGSRVDQEGDNIQQADEQIILGGSLNSVLAELETDLGVPIDWNPAEDGRSCFPASTTAYVGMAWWLPTDTDNEVQTDSVEFDIGFYAEQCRHNDGSGLGIGDDGTGTVEEIDLSTGSAGWQVTQTPDGSQSPEPAQLISPHDAWQTAACASWINPYGGDANTESDPVGDYTYELTFSLDSEAEDCTLDIPTFGSDNAVTFYLDDSPIGGSDGASAFDPLDGPISIDGIGGGSHTLRAEVENFSGASGNPTGLLVCGVVRCD